MEAVKKSWISPKAAKPKKDQKVEVLSTNGNIHTVTYQGLVSTIWSKGRYDGFGCFCDNVIVGWREKC